MGLFVNSNVASLNAQRNLNGATGALGRSFQRLSSGLRINSARDDAAGLAISNRFTAQVRGLNQAVRNTNDGISLAQTAEGALQESTNVVQRIRELAVQAANDTNTASDRESLQAEVDQLVAELDRIATTTSFNSNNILDGSFLGASFHVGANAKETININLADSRSSALGRQVRIDGSDGVGTAVATGALASGELVINGTAIRGTVAADDGASTTLSSASAIAKAAAINDSSEFTQVRAIVNGTTVGGADTGAITAQTLDSDDNIVINGQTITGFAIQKDDADDALVNAINAVADVTGVVASLDDQAQLVLTANDGRNIEVTVNNNGSSTGLSTGVYGGTLTLQSESQIEIETTVADVDSKLGFTAGTSAISAAAGKDVFGINSDKAIGTV
ncbi:MAG: flagellin, partial [Myxococcales bacterium]|nr:flagellin [Myxococcales bacterium]